MSFVKANIDNINLIIRSELIVFTHHFLIFFLKVGITKIFLASKLLPDRGFF